MKSAKLQVFSEHDRVVLTDGLPGTPRKAGDVGTIVHVYPGVEAFEIELPSPDGPPTIATVTPSRIRPLTTADINDARESGPSGEAVPLGYKRTEAGVIPQMWGVRQLRYCLACSPSYGVNAAAVPFDDSLPTYLRITDIGQDYRFRPSPRVSVRHPASHDYRLQEGDVVLARTGASVGKSYLYRTSDGPLVFAGFLIRLRPDSAVLNPRFLSYCLQSSRYWNWIAATSIRSGQPGINGHEYGTFVVPVPAIKEQQAITEVLSDMDCLLDSLDELIAKKRDVRHATTQLLVTGVIRLSGFSEEWKDWRLAEVGGFSKGMGIRRDQVTDDGSPCVLYGQLYTHYGDYVRQFVSHVPASVAESAVAIKAGDILFAGSGETAEEIGRCTAYVGERTAYAGGDIIVLTPSGHNSVYLACLLNSPQVASQKARFGQGYAVVHIGTQNLGRVELRLPSRREQDSIATIIVDMDAEIEALEHRRDKTRALKQGMMQQLLTGKTRMVEPSATGGKATAL